MTPPPIDAALSYLLTQHKSCDHYGVTPGMYQDRLYYELWNDNSGNLEMWLIRDPVTAADVDYALALATSRTDAIERNEYGLSYMAVIVTSHAPAPDIRRQIDALDNVRWLCLDTWIKKANEYMQVTP